MADYWDYVEMRCIEYVTNHGPCRSALVIEYLDETLQHMGKSHLQVINDVTRALADLSGNAPSSHGRKYPGGPPLVRSNKVYSLRGTDPSCSQSRLDGF